MATAYIETPVHDDALDDATVERLRAVLVAERSAQAELADRRELSVTELAGLGGPDSIVGRELASSAAARARRRVVDIDGALRRIALGVFGRCESCGSSIPAERLEVVPHATTCVRCAESDGGLLG